MKKNIYVIYGGKSVEHEVSFKTASFIMNALDKEKYKVIPVYITIEGVWCPLEEVKSKITDIEQLKKSASSGVTTSIGEFLTKVLKPEEENIVFPALHGTNGEDGTIQGFLELLDIPYVGNGVMGSALGIDKAVMKDLFTSANIPQTDYQTLRFVDFIEDEDYAIETLEKSIGYPCYIKPAKLGSSVGINRCSNQEELRTAIKEGFLYDRKLVVEQEVIGREMQIAVVGNDKPIASVVGEFIQERSFMDYNAKYIDGKLVAVIPARLTNEMSNSMRETAESVFKLLNCSGLVRVDYFVTDENYFVNEVNTMPGFTRLSMFPALWEKTDGTTIRELIEKFIALAIEKNHQQRALLNRRYE